jgi:hypothetical protein
MPAEQRTCSAVTNDLRLVSQGRSSLFCQGRGCGHTFREGDMCFMMGVWRGAYDDDKMLLFPEPRCWRCVNLLPVARTLVSKVVARVKTRQEEHFVDILDRMIRASDAATAKQVEIDSARYPSLRGGEHEPEEEARDSERREQGDDPGGLVYEVLERGLKEPGDKPCCHSSHKGYNDGCYGRRHLMWWI